MKYIWHISLDVPLRHRRRRWKDQRTRTNQNQIQKLAVLWEHGHKYAPVAIDQSPIHGTCVNFIIFLCINQTSNHFLSSGMYGKKNKTVTLKKNKKNLISSSGLLTLLQKKRQSWMKQENYKMWRKNKTITTTYLYWAKFIVNARIELKTFRLIE